MPQYSCVVEILRSDSLRWTLLEVVRDRRLPDCWIAAGFVRNAVWDAVHGRTANRLKGDVDVIWFDPFVTDAGYDRQIEIQLRAVIPEIDGSVKNQARMHVRNGDAPYLSATDAMRHWPETATAVAARRTDDGTCEIASPFGLDDLFNLIVRPTEQFAHEKHAIFERRVRSKAWLETWPRLTTAYR